jgi:solute carrier family 25 protein 38
MPISVVKVRMESPTCSVYSGLRNGLKTIYNSEGIPGFYRGLMPTVIREVPYSSLGYGFYEKYIQMINEVTSKDRSDPKVTMLAGSLAGFSATLITQPFDVLKTKIIYQRVSGSDCTSMKKAISSIYKEDGILGFQRGIIARLCRRLFSFPLVWTVYEQMKINI